MFLETEVFEKLCFAAFTAHRIKMFLFSQIVLETIFSIHYHDNEF